MNIDHIKVLSEKLLAFVELRNSYETNLEYFITEIRNYEREITSSNDKIFTRINKDYPLVQINKVQGETDGQTPKIPTIMGTIPRDSNEERFTNEQRIEEL